MELNSISTNLKLTRYDMTSEPRKKVNNNRTRYFGRKEMWQAIVIIVISLITIIAFFYLPWIIVSEELKINALQFSVALNGIIDFTSAVESELSNLPFTGINIKDTIEALKLFRTTNYIAFVIPAVNVILIILAIFIKKMKTLFSFVVFINIICIVISIAAIVMYNYLQIDYKFMIISIYENFKTDTYRIALSLEGFINAIIMAMSQSNIDTIEGFDAILRSSSFMTIILSIVNIVVSLVFYIMSNSRKMNRQAKNKAVSGDNI